MTPRSILNQMAITMLSMFALNMIASNVGGQTRKIIKGEQSLFERIFG